MPIIVPHNFTFAKSCGCRRESVLIIKPERFLWEDGMPTQVFLKEKGGKERYIHISKEYQPEIKRILDNTEVNEPLFNTYTKKIDNHAFKGEYAKARYKEILGERDDKKDYRGYDSMVLQILTVDLGHNRSDVALYNYLK